MPKTQVYHESAVEYNEALAAVAEELSEKLLDPEVAKWCTSIGRQHRFHAKRHRIALDELVKTATEEERPLSVQEEQARFAAKMEEDN